MKITKKVSAIVLALLMSLSMFAVAAMAADATDGSITINNTNEAVSMNGHTYTAYKLFDVTYDADKTNYSYTIAEGFQDFFTGKGLTSDRAAYDYVAALEGDALQAFAKEAFAEKTGTASSKSVTATQANQVVIDGLAHGYYLVYDEGNATAADNATKAISAAILTTTNPTVEVNLKADAPKLDKTITGIADTASNVAGEDSLKATDAQIGQHVLFKLNSTVPDLTGYTDYTYVASDTFTAGLTFDNNIKVMIGGADKTEDCTINVDGQTFDLTVPYATLKAATKGDAIVVTYSSTLNDNAIIYDTQGNTNSASLEYSNDPTDTTSSDTTPPTTVNVYTFELDITKRANDTEGEVLPGAEFLLKNADGDYIAVVLNEETGKYTVANGVEGTETNSKVVSDATGKVYVEGLAADTYLLTEIKAPDGYNLLTEDVTVTIEATYNEDNTAVTAVAGNTPIVINKSGSLLPTTGGIGTTIFTVVGIVIMAAAFVAFVVIKKKKSVGNAE